MLLSYPSKDVVRREGKRVDKDKKKSSKEIHRHPPLSSGAKPDDHFTAKREKSLLKTTGGKQVNQFKALDQQQSDWSLNSK